MHDRNGIWTFLMAPALLFALSAHSSEIQALVNDPAAAKEFDYCDWAYSSQERDNSLSRVQKILKESTNPVSGRTIASAVLVHAGTSVALAASSRKECVRQMKNGRKRFDKTLRQSARKFRRRADFDKSDSPDILTLQSEITRLWVADQAARVTYVQLQTDKTEGAFYWARQLAVAHAKLTDDEATLFMMTALESVDWVDSVRFGITVSRHAWILVQHADAHPDFQDTVLGRMQAYLSSGGVLKRDYAYLWDRVAVNSGRLQRFGTQPTWKCEDGKLTLHPMEDPVNVDKRRLDMGMETAAAALAEMARNTCQQ